MLVVLVTKPEVELVRWGVLLVVSAEAVDGTVVTGSGNEDTL